MSEGFDVTTPLGRHAQKERELSIHRSRLDPWWLGSNPACNDNNCEWVRRRNQAYEDYTKTPHPSTSQKETAK